MINTAHVGVSYKCNMNCKHCFVSKEKKGNVFYLHYKEIIQRLYNQGLYMLLYTYGEPLLSNEFYEVASFANKMDICQVLMTNGSLLTEDTIEKLKKIGINMVFVSVDSIDPVKHDENRNKKGAWELATNAIKLLVKNRINVGIACTITNDNYMEISDIYKLGQDLSVQQISFLRCRCNGKLIDFENNDIYVNQIKELILTCSCNDILIKLHDPLLLPMIDELKRNSQIDESLYSRYSSMCMCHKKHNINIAPNGDIYRCDFAIRPEGNIEDKEIILSDETCTCI